MRFGSAILISILLAKSSLTAEGITNYEWLLYIGTALSFFWVNPFLEALLPIYPKQNDSEKGAILFNAFLLYSSISLLIFVLLKFGSTFFIPLLTGRSSIPYFDTFLLFLLFNLPTVLVEYIYLLQKKSQWIVLYGMLSFGAYALAVLVPVFFDFGLEWSIQLIALVAFGKYLWCLALIIRYGQINRRLDLLREYVWLAIPLMAYAVVAGFAGVFDNWLVTRSFDSDQAFAIFRYGARELPLATALVGGISAAMIPRVVEDLGAALIELKDKARRMYHWVFPVSILLMLSSDALFPIIFSAEFAESAGIFKVYLLALVARVLLPYTLIMGLRQTKIILGVSILEMIVNVVFSLWFVQIWGMPGIAMATVVAFLFEKFTLSSLLKIKFDIRIQQYTDLRWYFFYSALLIGSYFLSLL